MEKIEFILIIIEFVCIAVQMGLSIYEIYLEKQSSKEMQKLMCKVGELNVKNN